MGRLWANWAAALLFIAAAIPGGCAQTAPKDPDTDAAIRFYVLSQVPGLTDEQAILPAEKTAPTILLKHHPTVRESSLGRFDLQLSGHTHGGQLLPWHLVTRLAYRHYRGWYDLPGGAALYATTGSGTWGPPVRLMARPEVALITLTAGTGNGSGKQNNIEH